MADEAARVPSQEPAAVGRLVRAAVAAEEARHLGVVVVRACVVRSAQPPLGVAHGVGSLGKVRLQVLVIALELAHPGEAPAVRLRVRRVAQLTRGAQPDLHLGDHPRVQEVGHLASEGRHEVRVHLDGRAPVQHGLVVHAKAQVLRVAPPASVGEQHILVLLGALKHPARQRDIAAIAHVAAALVEAQHHLHLEALALDAAHQRLVRAPVVAPGSLGLHYPPPHVRHHAVHPRRAERRELPLEPLRVGQRVDTRHRVQRQHGVHRHIARQTKLGQRRGVRRLLRLPRRGRRACVRVSLAGSSNAKSKLRILLACPCSDCRRWRAPRSLAAVARLVGSPGGWDGAALPTHDALESSASRRQVACPH
mmetsp:Transcript_12762/g.39698  ORF Transcript_12762/g.39698 Transcript_12762/m.39698 type:complete len:365 (+) Transcript_12762:3159-4253(+)